MRSRGLYKTLNGIVPFGDLWINGAHTAPALLLTLLGGGGKTTEVPCHAFLVVLMSVCTLAAYAVTSISVNHRELKYPLNSLPVLFVHNFVIMSLLIHMHMRDMYFSWYFNTMTRKLDYCTWDVFYMFGGVFCLWKKELWERWFVNVLLTRDRWRRCMKATVVVIWVSQGSPRNIRGVGRKLMLVVNV